MKAGRFLTARDIAGGLQISVPQAYRIIREMLHYRVGRSVRVPRAAFEVYLRRQETQAWQKDCSGEAPAMSGTPRTTTRTASAKPVPHKQLDKRAAAATLREWERRAADPAYAASHQATLEEALRGVLRDRKLKGRAEGTLECYRVKAGHLSRILGEQLRLREVTAKAVDSFIDRRLDEGAARNTIHKELTVLRSALKVAKRRGEFAGDIAAVMPDGFSTDYKPRERFLTAREAQALLAQLEPDRAARVAFILATGARWGESDRARVHDVDLNRGLVLLRGTKTKTSERFVPVVGFSVPLLEHALEHRQGDAPMLFRP